MSETGLKSSKNLADLAWSMILDKQLKALLQKHDVTVAQLARATKISAKTIYQWLNGQNPRDLKQVRKVADHFNVSIDFLAFGIDLKNKTEITDYREEINAGVFEVVLRRQKT